MKLAAKQTNWIVAQTVSFFNTPEMMGALHAPAKVLITAKAVGGESRWKAVEVIINNTPEIIISAPLGLDANAKRAGHSNGFTLETLSQTQRST